MKRPRLLRVEEGPEVFGALIRSLAAAGVRVGWLDLSAPPEPPAALEGAAAAGAMRAVAAGGGRAVAVKPLRGAPVLRDLLREHFLGCRAVLVRGAVEAPRLAPDGERWRLAAGGAPARRMTAEELCRWLRKSRV